MLLPRNLRGENLRELLQDKNSPANSVPAFNPADLGATLTLWLDASSTSSLNAPGTTFTNLGSVGGSFTGTCTPTAGAINGKRAALFNGTSDKFTSAKTLADVLVVSAWTMFAVFNSTTVGSLSSPAYANPGILADSGGYWGMHIGANKVVGYDYDGGEKDVPSSAGLTVTNGTTARLRYMKSGENILMNLNGGIDGSTAAGNIQVITGTLLFGANSSFGSFFKNYLCEILLCNTALSAGDETKVATYLQNKWGV
jgi:hypothetical protein